MNREQNQNFIANIALIVIPLCVILALSSAFPHVKQIPYSQFVKELDARIVDDVVVSPDRVSGKYVAGAHKGELFTTKRVDPALVPFLDKTGVRFSGESGENIWGQIFGSLLWVFLGILVLSAIMSKGTGANMGAGVFPMERNKARVYVETDTKVTFEDVAGVDEAKEELQEIINFLKEPATYKKLGGRLPKGILLVGPPGTGKTLLAKAVAGEAAVPFFSISGSEFVELFVGVGAARVRDLFAQARVKAPCIIFIDELDALGRARGISPLAGTHDEKEQTLNQLLVEMDGFDTSQGVVLLAATNRPEILDPALLRAGRFDRQVLVDRPDKAGRVQILNIYLKRIVTDPSIETEEVATMTAGFSGADLENIVNEAALLATRRGANAVEKSDFTAAIERVVAGLEKKNRRLSDNERRTVAYHEMGHALVSMLIPGTDPIEKVSIIPRGVAALGYTVQRPIEDRFLMSRRELQDKLTVLLGGRAAELLTFGDVSTGAADDLVKATTTARSMVMRYGMNEDIGLGVYEEESAAYLPGYQPSVHCSETTAREIDTAVRNLLDQAFSRAQLLLRGNINVLQRGANLLLDRETLTRSELVSLMPTDSEQTELCQLS